MVIGYDEKGLPKTKNVLAKTKRECQEKLKQLRETVTGPRTEKVRSEMPFGEWLDFWYQTYVKPPDPPHHPGQLRGENLSAHHPGTGEDPLNQLAQKDLQQFYARMKTGGGSSARSSSARASPTPWSAASTPPAGPALEKAVQEELIRTNPAVGCKLPPKRGREMQVLGREELQRFLIQAQAEGYFELFLLDLCTGLRRGRTAGPPVGRSGLQDRDPDREQAGLRGEGAAPGERPQDTGLHPQTGPAARRGGGAAAVSGDGGLPVDVPSPVKEDVPLTPGAVRRRLQIILERAGCKRIRFHDLRHTFATLSLESGMDVKTLSAMLGHVSAATTLDIYTHVTGDMQTEAAAKIDRGLGNKVQESPSQTEQSSAGDFRPVLRKTRSPAPGASPRSTTTCLRAVTPHLAGRHQAFQCVYAHTGRSARRS